MPSLLFVDALGISLLRQLVPAIQVNSETFEFHDFVVNNNLNNSVFDASNTCWQPLPRSSFSRFHLRINVEDPRKQPLMLEAGFLSFNNIILTERNPANQHLPSLTRLKRRALPGLFLPGLPVGSIQQAWRQVPGSQRSWRLPRCRNTSGIVVTSFNNPNWYHWLTLPGLGSLPVSHKADEMLLCDRSISVGSHSVSPLLERVGSLAASLFPDSQLIYEHGPILLRQLEACFIENHTSLVCDPNGLNKLRCAGRQLISCAHRIVDKDRIYLRRGWNSRRPLDEELSLEHALQIRGFAVIDAAALPLELCISIFASASWVVAPHGAALTNLIFATPGTKVLELLPGSLDIYGHYALISAALGLQHNIWYGHSNSSGGFVIEQGQMLSWLDAEISASMP